MNLDPLALLALLGLMAELWVATTILLARRRQPTATLAWLMAVIFLPVLGILLYLIIGRTGSRVRRVVRRARRAGHIALREATPESVNPVLHEPRTQTTLALGRGVGADDALGGNRVTLLQDAAATYAAMLAAIDRAQHQIHVQFYIIQSDHAGRALRDHLVACARRGVKVRVLYDDVGGKSLDRHFWTPLREQGGEVAVFNRVSPFTRRLRRRDRVDFRNHRKIVIVDDHVGFTGGINVGREYLGLDPSVGHWRDTHVCLEGPAVAALQRVFLRDWRIAGGRSAPASPTEATAAPPVGEALVQIVASGPDNVWSPIEHTFVHAITQARERVWIATPYFVPSPAVEAVILAAALRGVDVRLLVPLKADSLLVNLAARSYYRGLLEAGAKIYLYRRGFLHAKVMLIDHWMATVGSANLDVRSFYLNYELNAFVFDRPLVETMATQFMRDLADATRRNLADEDNLPLWRRLAQQSARLLSPLL